MLDSLLIGWHDVEIFSVTPTDRGDLYHYCRRGGGREVFFSLLCSNYFSAYLFQCVVSLLWNWRYTAGDFFGDFRICCPGGFAVSNLWCWGSCTGLLCRVATLRPSCGWNVVSVTVPFCLTFQVTLVFSSLPNVCVWILCLRHWLSIEWLK